MPSSSLRALDALAAAAAVYLVKQLIDQWKERLPLPPGPPGVLLRLPFFGNMFNLPKHHEWIHYADWSREYKSDIVHFSVGREHVIVLNSAEAATDLFDKRSAIYSDRPWTTMSSELVGFGYWNIVFMPYSPQNPTLWRDHRRVFDRQMSPDGVKRFRPQETLAVHEMLRRLLAAPQDYADHARHMAGQTILSIAYGLDVKPTDDPYIKIGEIANDIVAATTVPGSWLVDALSFLKYVPAWFPGAGFKRQANEWRRVADAMLNEPFEITKAAMAQGTARDSVTALLLQELEDGPDRAYKERLIKGATAIMYGAGSDTTVVVIENFFLAMTLYPQVLARAQAEVDRVVAGQRLPDFDDQPSLPYITAILKELLRWQQVDTLAVPHKVTEDDVYRGYFIPRGSTIIGNAWAILHDEKTYPDPHTFKPERWLLPDGSLDPDAKDPTPFFGFGRRLCPGRHLATESMWLSLACIIATFSISKACDEDGNEITPEIVYNTALLSHPAPFPTVVLPRSRGHEASIRDL
ncbi:cytochrome P450 [Exidia glandulosa HHB12029]|uniref:Cytochrome P450 n=1 Tax=Exidia glandulosa HHB12029 TaxID=1314781 RepID=A0A165LPM3_EXIGL|nr:cytochrome P450 [Exidia glandulosa HHB12029]